MPGSDTELMLRLVKLVPSQETSKANSQPKSVRSSHKGWTSRWSVPRLGREADRTNLFTTAFSVGVYPAIGAAYPPLTTCTRECSLTFIQRIGLLIFSLLLANP